MAKLPVVAMDTCCIIDWLQNTPGREAEVGAIAEIMDEMNRGEKEVVISAAVITEILPSRYKDNARYEEYRRLIRGTKLTVLPVDISIAEIVAHLRDELGLKDRKRMDAIHFGTAIHSRAECLYTIDSDLLKLNKHLKDIKQNKPVEGFKIRNPSNSSPV